MKAIICVTETQYYPPEDRVIADVLHEVGTDLATLASRLESLRVEVGRLASAVRLGHVTASDAGVGVSDLAAECLVLADRTLKSAYLAPLLVGLGAEGNEYTRRLLGLLCVHQVKE